jgi:REP element-mobilizing transposase RayT
LGCDRRRSKLRLYRGNVTTVALYRGKYRVESNRLQSWDYATPGWYFVTICTANRVCSLGEVVLGVVRLSQIGEIAQSELDNISTHYATVRVDSSIVTPNHIHAIMVLEGAHQYTPRVTAYNRSRRCRGKREAWVAIGGGSLVQGGGSAISTAAGAGVRMAGRVL